MEKLVLRPLISAEWDGNTEISSLNGDKLFFGFYIIEVEFKTNSEK